MSASTTSGIRGLVRSVVASNGASAGAGVGGSSDFGDETMRTFFAEIKGLVNSAFYALYEEVQGVPNKDEVWRASAMRRGLAFMNDRRNEGTIIDSVVESETACRSMTHQYFAAMHAFVRETVTQKHDLMRINFVPFGTFIARLYRKLAGVPEMREKYFTTMTYTEKDTLLRDVLRQVMCASVVWPSKSADASASASANKSFSLPIRPSDSVSNISHDHALPSVAGSVVGASVANAIMSVVKNDTGLSPEKLSTHNARISGGENASRFSNFTPASVTRTAKVVPVGETDPHALPRGPRGANADAGADADADMNTSSSRVSRANTSSRVSRTASRVSHTNE